MLDLAGFRDMFPEFQVVGDSLIVTNLDLAKGRVSPVVYGDQIDRAHGLMTAHAMTSGSSWGQSARLNPKAFDGKTIYSKALDEIRDERCAFRGAT